MTSPDRSDEESKFTYRTDGKVPAAVWLVGLGFLVFCVYYARAYAWPDFVVWLQQTSH